MAQNISLGIMLIGALFMFIASIGIVRMPDLFTRMHASTKSGTLGIGLMMLGVAIYFNDISVTARALSVVIFLFITAPVAAHMIGRAAYFQGVPLCEVTISDELRGHYDPHTHDLRSGAVIITLPPEQDEPSG